MNIVAVFVGVALIILLGAVLVTREGESPLSDTQSMATESQKLTLSGETLIVDVVRSQEDRRQGLSGRNELPEGNGMLFVFPTAGSHGIWMKDMHFAIDIIWFDAERRVVHIKESATPDTYPESFTSTTPALYVLEVPTGWVTRHGVQLGDSFSLE